MTATVNMWSFGNCIRRYVATRALLDVILGHMCSSAKFQTPETAAIFRQNGGAQAPPPRPIYQQIIFSGGGAERARTSLDDYGAIWEHIFIWHEGIFHGHSHNNAGSCPGNRYSQAVLGFSDPFTSKPPYDHET